MFRDSGLYLLLVSHPQDVSGSLICLLTNETRLASLRSHTDQFYDTIEIYQRKITRDNILPPQFAIRGKHTWDEVFQAAKDASNQSKNIRGFKGWMKKIGRDAVETAPYIQPLLEIIPNGDYTGALCGGLKIAFGVSYPMKSATFVAYTS